MEMNLFIEVKRFNKILHTWVDISIKILVNTEIKLN